VTSALLHTSAIEEADGAYLPSDAMVRPLHRTALALKFGFSVRAGIKIAAVQDPFGNRLGIIA
jgi:hypothetical protein